MIDLNSLIAVGSPWTLYEADGINDAGQITGIGNIGGHNHAFLLTPVPEPSSVVLSAFACAAILWRRKQSRSPRSGQRG